MRNFEKNKSPNLEPTLSKLRDLSIYLFFTRFCFVFFSIPRFFELETAFTSINNCTEKRVQNISQDVPNSLELLSSTIKTNSCRTELVPSLVVTEMRQDAYYVSVSHVFF